MLTAYLSLGSNLGDREANLRGALSRLNDGPVRVRHASSIYETEPVGETPESVPAYLNCAAEIETALSPVELLEYIQAIERALGRMPTFRWGPRIIDIDLLLYDGVTLESERLTLPHARLFERAFALAPLAEIAPDLRFPDGSTISERLQDPTVLGQAVQLIDGGERR